MVKTKKRRLAEEAAGISVKYEVEEEGVAEAKEPEPEEVKAKPVKPAKPSKPLPEGYTCNACGAVGDHAIYNCPLKIVQTKPKKRALSDLDEPSAEAPPADSVAEEIAVPVPVKKVKTPKVPKVKSEDAEPKAQRFSAFVAGLPFETTRDSLLKYIREHMEWCNNVTARDIIVLTFPDNPKKCKGLAYVNFDTQAELQDCLKLNGMKIGEMNLTVMESKLPVKGKGEIKPKAKEGRCYRCGQKHEPKDCTNPRVCYRCKSTEHISTKCPMRKSA